jgi:hypothetical protein
MIAFVDFVTIIRSRLKKNYEINSDNPEDEKEDFSLLVPIFGDIKYLKNTENLKKYGSKVILCTTTHESEKFYADLKKVSELYNFRIFKSHVRNFKSKTASKANPWRLFRNTLHDDVAEKIVSPDVRDEIIKDSFDSVQTDYCIFIDGDTTTPEHLGKLVRLMRESDFDLASVRVIPSKQNTIMEKLQTLEYELAMDSRKLYPWLTSGAGMIAKTDVIKLLMHHHSLFFSGGDIEIGKLGSMLKYKVGHIPFVFLTDVPETFNAWFKQRRAWFGGGFRHVVLNMNQHLWTHPFHFIYFTILVYLMYPLRVYEVIKYPWIIPILILVYWILIFSFHWKERKLHYLLFPFYALFQVMVIVPLGVLKYLKMVQQTKNIGLIRLRHKDHRKERLKNHEHITNETFGYLIIFLTFLFVIGYTVFRMSDNSFTPITDLILKLMVLFE